MRVGVLELLACVVLLSPFCAFGATWPVEDLGIPVNAVTYVNSEAVLGPGPGGEGTMFYTSYYRNTGAELVGCDFKTGTSLRKKLPSQGGYGLTVGHDGSLYVGGVNPGDLYRYNPKDEVLTTLDVKQFGVQYIWEAATAPDGTIYCAAGYPQSRLVSFNPATGVLRDHGKMVPDEQYLRSLCVDAHGKVWCGVGMHAHLIVFDPEDGSKRNVLPKDLADASCVHGLKRVGGYVVCAVEFEGVLLVYDAATKELARRLALPEDEVMWFTAQGDTGDTAWAGTFPSRDLYRLALPDGKLEHKVERCASAKLIVGGRELHGMEDQDYVVRDLQEDRVLFRERLTEGGDGMNIFALTRGPDGDIYGSTYINMHMFKCSAETGKLTDLGKCSRWEGQVDSLSLGHDGRIWIGAYVYAVMSVYDPGNAWNPGRAPGANPREIGPLGKGQYRTQTNCLGPDGKLYAGSIPSYNTAKTGAFSICNPETGAMDTRTDFVSGGTVTRLVAGDRYVYGAGGGEFFAYDPQKDTKHFWEKRPVTSMAILGNDRIAGSGGGKIFVYDRKQNRIVDEAANPAGDFSHMARGRDGSVYGVNRECVAQVGEDGKTVMVLAEPGGQFAAVDASGNVYFARGPRLFRCVRP